MSKLPRNDLDAERQLLNAILTRAGVYDSIVSVVGPKHFFAPLHEKLMKAAAELAEEGIDVNEESVRGQMLDRDMTNAVDAAELFKAIGLAQRAGRPVETAGRIRDMWAQREACDLAHRIAGECYGDVGDVSAYLDKCAAELGALSSSGSASTMVTFAQAIERGFQGVQEAARGPQGVLTGIRDLDTKVCGFLPGDLVVVGARPGMGKTALGFQIALEEAKRGRGVIVFSLEMRAAQLGMRAVCSSARVDSKRLRGNSASPDDWRRLTQSATELATLPIYIDDVSGQTPAQIRAKAKGKRAELAKRGVELGCIVVDYLQLMDGSRGPRSIREQEVAFCSTQLKAIAKDLGVPVIALAQLRRAPNGSKPARPSLSDLRESGQIEQDADVVVFIHREEYYLLDKTPPEERGVAELIVAKDRNGSASVTRVHFFDYCTLFADMAPDHQAGGFNGYQ